MIAGLPMYLRPENRTAHLAFWALARQALGDHGVRSPAALDPGDDPWALWQDPGLVLANTCNLPYRMRLHGQVTLVGASDYGLPQAGPGEYYAVFVARADDPRDSVAAFAGARFALNGADSNSGWAAPQAWTRERGIALRPTLVTGAHRESLRAVAEGSADIACLDAVTWRMCARYDPQAARVRVLDRTDTSPGISFITRAGQDPQPYRTALAQALAALPAGHAIELGLRAVVALPAARYLELGLPKPPDLPAKAAEPGD